MVALVTCKEVYIMHHGYRSTQGHTWALLAGCLAFFWLVVPGKARRRRYRARQRCEHAGWRIQAAGCVLAVLVGTCTATAYM